MYLSGTGDHIDGAAGSSKATLGLREDLLYNYLQAVQEDPGEDLASDREKRNATTFSSGFTIAFLKDGNNNGVFEVFRNLLVFPRFQDETEVAALQLKATVLNQFVRDVVRAGGLSWGHSLHCFLKLHKRWWLTHTGLRGMR